MSKGQFVDPCTEFPTISCKNDMLNSIAVCFCIAQNHLLALANQLCSKHLQCTATFGKVWSRNNLQPKTKCCGRLLTIKIRHMCSKAWNCRQHSSGVAVVSVSVHTTTPGGYFGYSQAFEGLELSST